VNDHDPPAEQPDPISEGGDEEAHSGHTRAWRAPLTLVLAFAAAITLIIAARSGGSGVTHTPNDAAPAGFNPWPPLGTPTTYVVDTHGRIAAVFFGRTDYSGLQPVVEQVVELG
jgi:hypothetical protein